MTNEKAPERIWLSPASFTYKTSPAPTYIYSETEREPQDIEYARVDRKYFCSCGGALTAEEYITHFLEFGHDRAHPAAAASAALVVDNSVAFNAYNQAIEDVKAAIRGEPTTEHGDDDGSYFAAVFINAIARKCSPHGYVNRLAAAATAAPVEQSEHDSCSHWRESDSDNCLLCGDDLGPVTDTATLNQIKRICDLGSAREFGDALKRLESIRKLIDAHEGAR